jgi:hypothetical protein
MRKSVLQVFIVTIFVTSPSLGFAIAHTDACVYNYNQCVNGCGGASGCETQCKANYDGCMAQDNDSNFL